MAPECLAVEGAVRAEEAVTERAPQPHVRRPARLNRPPRHGVRVDHTQVMFARQLRRHRRLARRDPSCQADQLHSLVCHWLFTATPTMSQLYMRRLQKEYRDLKTDPPAGMELEDTTDLSLCAARAARAARGRGRHDD
jgi:hypothetical protein